MELQTIRFEEIAGPHSSKRENFEELINNLFCDKEGFITFNGSGGDGGADCIFYINENKRVVVQAKYFLRKISNSQRQQIQKSFRRAIEYYKPDYWILCTPINPTTTEHKRLLNFAKEWPKVSVQWWGYTKLVDEILKRKEIVDYYFPNVKYSNRLIYLEEKSSKIHEIVVELRKHFLDCEYVLPSRHDYSYLALEYLRRLSNIVPGIRKELGFIESIDTFEVLIDFSDIFSFMNAHPLHHNEMAISDYCIKNSSEPILIPPGALYEMEKYLHVIKNYDKEIDRVRMKELLLNFIFKYERDPNSIQTYKSYETLMKFLSEFGIHPDLGFGKLRLALELGIIKPLAEQDIIIGADKVFFQKVFKWFSTLRPFKPEPNLVDATNLELLTRMQEKRNGRIRFLSSAKSFLDAALMFCGENHLVRTAIQYASILYIKHWYKKKGQAINRIENFFNNMEKIVYGMESMLKFWNTESILQTGDKDAAIKMLNNLHKFKLYYDDFFKPIDKMIYKEAEFIEPMKRQSPEGLYRMLISDYDVTRGFEKWWEESLNEVAKLSEYLKKNVGIGDTVRSLEELGGKSFIEEKKKANEQRAKEKKNSSD